MTNHYIGMSYEDRPFGVSGPESVLKVGLISVGKLMSGSIVSSSIPGLQQQAEEEPQRLGTSSG